MRISYMCERVGVCVHMCTCSNVRMRACADACVIVCLRVRIDMRVRGCEDTLPCVEHYYHVRRCRYSLFIIQARLVSASSATNLLHRNRHH